MIKLISTDDDVSSNNIAEFLLGFNVTFLRHNIEELTSVTIYLSNEKTVLPFENTYHRRGRINTLSNEHKNEIFYDYLIKEENPVIKSIEYISKNQNGNNYVGEYNEEEQHNKIIDLFLAKEIGFIIPKTLISNCKSEIISFYNECKKKIITKCIKYPLEVTTKEYQIFGKNTFLVKKKDIISLAELNSFGLYQECIQKKYEIRIFVYKDLIFSMAIFSQQNKKTILDYRNYDEKKPNRCVPYKLPDEIEKKIKQFFKLKNINTGSVDVIVNSDNEYIFLENNPQGQFDWLSKNCNYYIEKIIAQDLFSNNIK